MTHPTRLHRKKTGKRLHETLFKALGLRERTLGVARTGRGRYDLPLAGGAGTGFLILLIALMTFLATLALFGSFALRGLGAHWSSGLEGKATVEIPATDPEGKVLPESVRTENRDKILDFLKGAPAIAEARALDHAEIAALVGPWLGDAGPQSGLQGIALPTLITLSLARRDGDSITALERKIHLLVPRARLDTHQDWLGDMLRLTDALWTASLILALVTGATTAACVGGAVRSRMAEHKADIEILHLMGATDSYIIRQFQRHAIGLALRGGLIGLCGAGAVIFLTGVIAGDATSAILPDISLSVSQTVILLALPILAAGIACAAARLTVSRALAHMP